MVYDRQLFELLRKWRRSEAQERGVDVSQDRGGVMTSSSFGIQIQESRSKLYLVIKVELLRWHGQATVVLPPVHWIKPSLFGTSQPANPRTS